MKGAAPALGIARHAIDAVIESAAAKPTRRYTVGGRMKKGTCDKSQARRHYSAVERGRR
jgi:hypothetical protein